MQQRWVLVMVGLLAGCAADTTPEGGYGGSAANDGGSVGGDSGVGADVGMGSDAVDGGGAGTGGGGAGGTDAGGDDVSLCETGSKEDLTIPGDTVDNGFFDPSLEWDGVTLWMSYSHVRPAGTNKYVDTHIASSSDNGVTWKFELELNTSYDDGAKAWQEETSSLIYDPADPDTNSRWKIFWYEWWEHGTKSWIAYRHAPSPAGPWSNKEILFAGKFLDPSFTARITVNNLDSILSNTAAVTEPGAFVDSTGTIYLALQACESTGCLRIVLVKSVDHGANWLFVSELTNTADAQKLSTSSLGAPDIFHAPGGTYMLATPSNAQGKYEGLVVFRFADLASGKLDRDAKGALVVVKSPDDNNGQHRGAGTYDQRNKGGVLMSQLRQPTTPFFNIVKLHACLP